MLEKYRKAPGGIKNFGCLFYFTLCRAIRKNYRTKRNQGTIDTDGAA